MNFEKQKEYAIKRVREIFDKAKYVQTMDILISFHDFNEIPTITYKIKETIVEDGK